MRFKAKKQYGNYKVIRCPFCQGQATQKNEQGIEVCPKHVKSKFEEIKCTCGSWLEQRVGKFGAYFNCINCGNFNFQKAMQIKDITMKDAPTSTTQEKPKPSYSKPAPKEITITSDDVEYFD